MTDKERLEQIKTQGFGTMKYLHLDIRWLIEQAERVEELEIGIDYLQSNIKGLQKNVDTLRETRVIVANAHQDNLERKDAEIDRLREALKFYADEENNLLVDGENTTVSIDAGKIARQALSNIN